MLLNCIKNITAWHCSNKSAKIRKSDGVMNVTNSHLLVSLIQSLQYLRIQSYLLIHHQMASKHPSLPPTRSHASPTSPHERTPQSSQRNESSNAYPSTPSNATRTPERNRAHTSPRIPPPTSPFIPPTRRQSFFYNTPFNSPRSSPMDTRQDPSASYLLPSPPIPQSFSEIQCTRSRDQEYVFIPMPSLPPSSEQLANEGPSNNRDVAPGLRASLTRNAPRG